MTRKLLLLVVLAAILGLYSTAYADTIYSQTYSIVTPDDINTADGTPPFATVLVTLNDTQNTAEFVFTATNGYVFGGADAIAIRVGTFATPAATISTTGGLAPTLTGDFTTSAVSTFGNFNIIYSFVKADGTSPFNQGYFTSATIDLTGVTAKSLEKLFDPNGKGYFIAAHLRLEDAVLIQLQNIHSKLLIIVILSPSPGLSSSLVQAWSAWWVTPENGGKINLRIHGNTS